MRRSAVAPAVLVVAIAAVTLYRGAYSASNLEIVPDSVEYALAAHRLVTEGHYSIMVGGRDLPPRYPPWFSLLVIAPAYAILGPEPGNAIYPVTALALAGVLIAFAIGHRIGGAWGGALGALAVLMLPDYRQCGRLILTDVPAATLLLGSCALYLRVRSTAGGETAVYLLAGILVATATLLRPVAAAGAIPFVLAAVSSGGTPAALRRLAVLLGPVLVGTTAALAYNELTFGSPWRSGYNFWCPVPYDYPTLTFSTAYLGRNLVLVWKTGLPPIAAVGVALVLAAWPPPASRSDARRLIEFLIFGAGPMTLFYLFYFFPHSRFFLPALVMSTLLLGAVVGARVDRLPRGVLLLMLAALLGESVVLRIHAPDPPPRRRLAADQINTGTPRNAIIISGVEPAYLEYLVARRSARRVLPLSRSIEYANKLIAPRRLSLRVTPDLTCRDDPACPALVDAGAQLAVPEVASERLDELAREVARGGPVFLDASGARDLDARVLRDIAQRFTMVPRAEGLLQLTPRR